MVSRTETWIANPVLGDMPVETTYSGYKDFNGVKFPTMIVQKQGGYPVLDLAVTSLWLMSDVRSRFILWRATLTIPA